MGFENRNIILQQLLLSSVVFIAVQILMLPIIWLLGFSYFDPNTWVRWDSGIYLFIAEHGYVMMPCEEGHGFPLKDAVNCGNAAWFPGYAYLAKGLSFLFPSIASAANFLAKAFYLLTLFLFCRIAKLNEFNKENILNLSIAACCFGFIYYMAAFPISCMLFFILLGFYLFLNQKYLLAAVCCFILAVTYSTGFLFAFVLATTYFLEHRKEISFLNIFRLGLFLGAGGLGVLSVFYIFYIQVDDFFAFFKIQENYGNGAHNPLFNMIEKFQAFAIKRGIRNLIQVQSLIVIIGYGLISYRFFKLKWHQKPMYLLTYVYLSYYFWLPWTIGGHLSMYRAESLLLPFAFLLNEFKLRHRRNLLLFLIPTGMVLAYLYFNNELI